MMTLICLSYTSGTLYVYLRTTASCVEEQKGDSCLHEYHLFGTNDHTAASIKLGILLVMFILNVSTQIFSF